jgi:hypothetical protein
MSLIDSNDFDAAAERFSLIEMDWDGEPDGSEGDDAPETAPTPAPAPESAQEPVSAVLTYVKCDLCGDESNSAPNLLCGRLFDNGNTCPGTYREISADTGAMLAAPEPAPTPVVAPEPVPAPAAVAAAAAAVPAPVPLSVDEHVNYTSRAGRTAEYRVNRTSTRYGSLRVQLQRGDLSFWVDASLCVRVNPAPAEPALDDAAVAAYSEQPINELIAESAPALPVVVPGGTDYPAIEPAVAVEPAITTAVAAVASGSVATATVPTPTRSRRRANRSRRTATAQELRRAARRQQIALTLTNDSNALGIEIGWNGKGERTAGQLSEWRAACGLPADLDPEGMSVKAALGQAINLLRARHHRCDHLGSGKDADGRSYSSRYSISDQNERAQVGDSSGTVRAQATIYGAGKAGQLVLDGPEHLVSLVRAEFERCSSGRVLKAAAVTAWIESVLVNEYDAVRYGPNWCVPAPFDQAERFASHAREQWGADWHDHFPRITTGGAMAANIAGGIVKEIDAIAKAMTQAEKTAAEKTDPTTIRESTAVGYLADLRSVQKKAELFLSQLDSAAVERVNERCAELVARCAQYASGAAQRFSLLELDSRPSNETCERRDPAAERWGRRDAAEQA